MLNQEQGRQLHDRASHKNRTILGKIQGKTIQLDEDPQLPDGLEVQVQLMVPPQAKKWGDGLRRGAGVLANEWTPEDDRILEEIYQDRLRDSRPEIPG